MDTKPLPYLKMYICVLDEFPDFMVPTLVAHSVLGAHQQFQPTNDSYNEWLQKSFRKVVVRVNSREFQTIQALGTQLVYLGHENNTLGARKACAVVAPVRSDSLPNVLKYAKLWKPKEVLNATETE